MALQVAKDSIPQIVAVPFLFEGFAIGIVAFDLTEGETFLF